MFKFIFKILGFKQKAKKQSIGKSAEKNIVASLSRGNIHLQNGRYLTTADIDAMRKKAFN